MHMLLGSPGPLVVRCLVNGATNFKPQKKYKTAFKPLKTLGHVFKQPKDRPTGQQLKGIIYKVSCMLEIVPIYIFWRE